jgi:hypothetical protein
MRQVHCKKSKGSLYEDLGMLRLRRHKGVLVHENSVWQSLHANQGCQSKNSYRKPQ